MGAGTKAKTLNTIPNLRACLTALLADEQSGCSREHLDTVLNNLAYAANQLPLVQLQLDRHAHEFKQLRDALGCSGSDLEQLLGAVARLKQEPTGFREFPKIARLSREVIITEKLDGSNAQICITEDGQFLIGSRTRWITPEQDNHGFARWATEHREELLTLGPGRHFGEWWGNGVQRGYGLPKGEKRFSLFNVMRWCLHGETPQRIPCGDPRIEKWQQPLPPCCGLVPVLYRGMFTTDACQDALSELRVNGSKAAPGYLKPEGIVCFHIAGNFGLKKTLEKDEAPKSA